MHCYATRPFYAGFLSPTPAQFCFPLHLPVTIRMGTVLNCARSKRSWALLCCPRSFAKVLAPASQTQKTSRRYTTANATSTSAIHNSTILPPPTTTTSSVPASALSFGQPIHETHPHLIGSGDRTRSPYPSSTILLITLDSHSQYLCFRVPLAPGPLSIPTSPGQRCYFSLCATPIPCWCCLSRVSPEHRLPLFNWVV